MAKSDRLATRLVQAAFFVALLAAWTIESALRLVNPILFPRIGDVAKDFTIAVVVESGNHAPIVTSNPRTTATVGRPYALDLKGFDEDNDLLTWSLVTAPRGVSLDALSGRLRWTPTADQLGAQPVVVRVQDTLGASSTQSFTVDVACVNRAPAVSSTPPTTAAVGVGYFYAVRAIDPEFPDELSDEFRDDRPSR